MTTNEESSLLQSPTTDDQDLQNGTTRSTIRSSFLAVMLLSSFLASSDDSFVLSTASDIAAEFEATTVSTWLITGFNLGYMVSLPVKNFSMAAASACLAPSALGGALGGYLAGKQIQTLVPRN
ncbi:hypothetical protein N7486_002759 [Penicillium sp. IBT 16267x]|nr:hypothetical protein N7486_002759 [Penicillium sp. IBT 16267x]